MNEKITVIGAGSFGTALAVLLAGKEFDVSLWGRKKSQIALMKDTRENPHYLPGVKLPENLKLSDDMEACLCGAKTVVFSVPAQSFRSVLETAKKFMEPGAAVVNVAKGIEKGTLMRLSQIAEEIVPDIRYAALSGPSHAEEVARQLPTTVTVASK